MSLNIEKKIQQYIESIANRNVAIDEELLDSGILDSFSFVEIVEFIEKDLGITLDFKKIGKERFKSIQDITATLAEMNND